MSLALEFETDPSRPTSGTPLRSVSLLGSSRSGWPARRGEVSLLESALHPAWLLWTRRQRRFLSKLRRKKRDTLPSLSGFSRYFPSTKGGVLSSRPARMATTTASRVTAQPTPTTSSTLSKIQGAFPQQRVDVEALWPARLSIAGGPCKLWRSQIGPVQLRSPQVGAAQIGL